MSREHVTPHVEAGPGGRPSPAAAVATGAVFLASGAALVAHVLLGAPLPLTLVGLAATGGAVAWHVLRRADVSTGGWVRRVRAGVLAGLMATLAYDAARLVLVQAAALPLSPFGAFPLFGAALLGSGAAGGTRFAAGVAFHLLNGVAFSAAYAVWFGPRGVRWGVAYGLGLEAFMLALYPGWLDIRAIAEFTQMSVVGHVVYGAVLGLLTRRLLGRRA